jgi:G:T/U-mismatch repair DNA glycosylase
MGIQIPRTGFAYASVSGKFWRTYNDTREIK